MITEYFSSNNIDEIKEKELELKRLAPIFTFLNKKEENYTYQFIYHNVQSLQVHHLDISCNDHFMQSDFLLLSETWTILGDHFKFPGFKLCVETYSSLNQTRKQSGVAIYAKESINVTKTKEYTHYDNGIHMAVVYIQNNIRFAVLYAKPSSNTDQILEVIKKVLGNDFSEYKTVLAGNFNFNMNTPNGNIFYDMFKQSFWWWTDDETKQNRAAIGSILSTHDFFKNS